MMEAGRYLVGETRLPDVTSGSVGDVANDPLIGDNRIYLHGVVRYLDIFGVENLQPERRYEFCFVYHPDRDPIGTERGCETHLLQCDLLSN